jgi:hypothetical protein
MKQHENHCAGAGVYGEASSSYSALSQTARKREWKKITRNRPHFCACDRSLWTLGWLSSSRRSLSLCPSAPCPRDSCPSCVRGAGCPAAAQLPAAEAEQSRPEWFLALIRVGTKQEKTRAEAHPRETTKRICKGNGIQPLDRKRGPNHPPPIDSSISTNHPRALLFLFPARQVPARVSAGLRPTSPPLPVPDIFRGRWCRLGHRYLILGGVDLPIDQSITIKQLPFAYKEVHRQPLIIITTCGPFF